MPKIKVDKLRARELRDHGWTLSAIAAEFGVTKGAITGALKRIGTRVNQNREPEPCGCGCGEPIIPPKKYASLGCYFRVVNRSGPSVLVRHKQRSARVVVAALFDLQPEHVVHHVDKNNHNNDPLNLWVFASQADHMRFHRGGDAIPVWQGAK